MSSSMVRWMCGHRPDGFAHLATDLPIRADVVLAELLAEQMALTRGVVPDVRIGQPRHQPHLLRIDDEAEMFC